MQVPAVGQGVMTTRSWWTGKYGHPFSACKQPKTPSSRASEPGGCRNPSRSASVTLCVFACLALCPCEDLFQPGCGRCQTVKASEAFDCLHFLKVGLSIGAYSLLAVCVSVCLCCMCCLYVPKVEGSKNRMQEVPKWCCSAA